MHRSIRFRALVATTLTALSITTAHAAALLPGETLWAGQSLYSDDHRYFAAMQTDGNLVVYRNDGTHKAVWSTQTTGRGVNRAVMQADGNFVLYTADHQAIWWTGSNGPSRMFTVTEHGQAMILAVVPTWSSGSGSPGLAAGDPIVFRDGTYFPKGHIYSQINGHSLSFQTDGNMVLYRYGNPIWSSNTWRAESALFANGLHVTGGKKRNFHAGSLPAPKYGPGTKLMNTLGFLTLEPNGNLVTYGVKEIWTASEYDRQPARYPGAIPCLGDPRLCGTLNERGVWKIRLGG